MGNNRPIIKPNSPQLRGYLLGQHRSYLNWGQLSTPVVIKKKCGAHCNGDTSVGTKRQPRGHGGQVWSQLRSGLRPAAGCLGGHPLTALKQCLHPRAHPSPPPSLMIAKADAVNEDDIYDYGDYCSLALPKRILCVLDLIFIIMVLTTTACLWMHIFEEA